MFSDGLLHMDTLMLSNQQKFTFICVDTECRLEDLPSMMANKDR